MLAIVRITSAVVAAISGTTRLSRRISAMSLWGKWFAADIKKQLEETLDTRTLDAQNPLTRKPVAFFQDDTELRGKRRKLEGMEGLAGVYGTGLSDVSVTLACYADAGEATTEARTRGGTDRTRARSSAD